MKVIALDSSGLVASAAIAEDDILIAEYNVQYKKTHSQTLLPMLDAIRQMTELDLATVDAIALAAGPGSFTGLRIGSATAKGLGFALEKPLVEIPTADGLAYNLYGSADIVCPLMDARRNQVYTGIYQFVRSRDDMPFQYKMDVLKPQDVVAIEDIAGLLNEMGREVIFLGDGVPVFADRLAELMKIPYGFAPAHMNRQRAAALASLALVYLAKGKTVPAEAHVPVYLRLSQAEREKSAPAIVRPMTREDVAAVSQIEAEVFTMPWKADDFLEMIEADYAYYYVAEMDGEPVGVCGLRNAAGEGQITNVAVTAKYRRRGIARKLVRHMLEEAVLAGMQSYALEVRVSNHQAIALYESLGFRHAGVRPGFYEKPDEDALIMLKESISNKKTKKM